MVLSIHFGMSALCARPGKFRAAMIVGNEVWQEGDDFDTAHDAAQAGEDAMLHSRALKEVVGDLGINGFSVYDEHGRLCNPAPDA
jgi:hypothetical protein